MEILITGVPKKMTNGGGKFLPACECSDDISRNLK